MKHKNIAIFIPHLGCPNDCSFCNQHIISSTISSPDVDSVEQVLTQAYHEIADKSTTEIAFFGGSFTAISHEYMIDLLTVANKFIGENGFIGIRISTRPDKIDSDILTTLKRYNVASIELGAQSMVDSILKANRRGHSRSDVISACELISSFGFELGLQMMVGLYTSSYADEIATAREIIALSPATVRIYPTVVLQSTHLAELFHSGEYAPISLEEGVSTCSELLHLFHSSNINVIKLGLHSSDDVENSMVAGVYHPAFRELCESKIYLKIMLDKLHGIDSTREVVFYVARGCVSKAIGQKRSNLLYLHSMGICAKIKEDTNLTLFEVYAMCVS